MADIQFLDDFEKTLRDGLLKVCRSYGLLSEDVFRRSQDIDDAWEEGLMKDFVADAVENFNGYPEATLAWAGYLGMAVANGWDADWDTHRNDSYQSFYGPDGFDDMDENIVGNILKLAGDYADKIKECLYSCAEATLGLIRHQGIEAHTSNGFYVLVRAYTVFYQIGAALELKRLGYKMVAVDVNRLLN